MANYKNEQELKQTINEGYFNNNSYEKISHKSVLLEQVLNMAKNNKDDIFRHLQKLVEEVVEIESKLKDEVDADQFIKDNIDEENSKISMIDELPLTTLAIKKLDGEEVETIKWLVAKKTGTAFDDGKIFELNDVEFKKMLIKLVDNVDKELLKKNEIEFTQKAIDNNTKEVLVEDFLRFAGQAIKEEADVDIPSDKGNEYYFHVKQQLDSIKDQDIKDNMESSYEASFEDSGEVDITDMMDQVPDNIKADTYLGYAKNSIDGVEVEEENKDNPITGLDDSEDQEFLEIAEKDAAIDGKMMTREEQTERQKGLIESLKELYIIKRTKDTIMLEASHLLISTSNKRKLLERTLMFQESAKNTDKSEYAEKVMRINLLVESLIRKYIPKIIEG